MKCLTTSLILILVFLVNGSASATLIPAVSFTDASHVFQSGFSIGFEFTPVSDISISHLGYYDRDGDGLGVSSDVGIFTTSDTLLVPGASTTVLAGTGELLMGDATQGYYRYHALSSVITLTGGTTYRIAGVSGTNGYAYNATPTFVDFASAPAISMGLGYFAGSGTLAYPTTTNGLGNPIFGGGNFLIFTPDVVPEPSSFLLLGLGALGMVRHTRRRRRGRA